MVRTINQPRRLTRSAASACAAAASSLVLAGTVNESFLIKPPDLPADYGFAYAVALDGETIVAGGANSSEQGDDPGSAYVFTQGADGEWVQRARLQPSDGQLFDNFGAAVGVSDSFILVTSSHDDDLGFLSGSAYLFALTADGAWVEQAKLVADDGGERHWFGLHAAFAGETALIGAHGVADNRGAAYVFEPDAAGAWSQRTKLEAPDGEPGDNFGRAVALASHRALVGARGDDDTAIGGGSAYVFRRTGAGDWILEAKLLAGDGDSLDFFGYSVAVTNHLAVVGARGEDENGYNAGAAYVFARETGGVWTQRVKLLASDGREHDRFGQTVAIWGDRVVVGAPYGGFENEGVAYLFEPGDEPDEWVQIARLEASAPSHDQLGWSLAAAGEFAVMGSTLR